MYQSIRNLMTPPLLNLLNWKWWPGFWKKVCNNTIGLVYFQHLFFMKNSNFTSNFPDKWFCFTYIDLKPIFFGFLDPKNIYFDTKFKMKAIAWKYPYFWQPFLEKTQNISKTVKPIKKVLRTKGIENLISHMECAIRFNVSPTIIVLLQ